MVLSQLRGLTQPRGSSWCHPVPRPVSPHSSSVAVPPKLAPAPEKSPPPVALQGCLTES